MIKQLQKVNTSKYSAFCDYRTLRTEKNANFAEYPLTAARITKKKKINTYNYFLYSLYNYRCDVSVFIRIFLYNYRRNNK